MPGNAEARRSSSSMVSSMAAAAAGAGDPAGGEPSAVPPYWNFSTRNSNVLDRQAQSSSSSILHSHPASGEPSRDLMHNSSSSMPGSYIHSPEVEDGDTAMLSVADAAAIDPAKPPASGANATPLSPRSRYRRGLQLEEEGEQQHSQSRILCAGCSRSPQACKCQSGSALSSSPTAPAAVQSDPLDYMRPCSWLRPGAVFTGQQSFTSYVPHPSSSSSHSSSPYRASSALAQMAADRRPSPYPSSSHPAAYSSISRHFPSWGDLSGSALDPAMTAFLGANGSFGYSSASSINRSHGKTPCVKEEWEVQVCICAVDWENGRIEGLMKALNVPNSPPASAWEDPKPDSGASSVTTSFIGEIVDLHNYSLWTRPTPLSSSSVHSRQPAQADTVWLSQHQSVDKTTDLEYWSKIEAFTSYGPGAEKEICRIAREGSWHKDGSRRRDVGDWVLMRWKEKDFIDCDASASGLTISGYYYCCLNRKTGALSGFYYDPSSTPHQRLELHPASSSSSSLTRKPVGHWTASYSAL